GHYDTVHPAGSFPVKTEGNKLYGPGVYDMKSGLVAGIWCVKACQDLGLPLNKKLVFVFNGDEETGSAESKEIIAQYAKEASAAVILEPSTDSGNLKTGRKGILHLYVTIHGKAAHAGNNHAEGVNAIEEMAREIVAIQSLTDYEAGTTVNVGVCSGGSKVNVVPDLALFEVDCRFKTKAERQRVWDAVTNLSVFDCRTTREVSGGAGKMPMEETEENLKLFETAKECAAMAGLDVDHEFVGGGSDGNEISAMGIPTIDGMGAYGANAHSREEYIDTAQYIQRIAMVTLFAGKL
ncbi:MAG: M20 family metallopeptidase, partial [Erysipelotrichaceae bacterium]|nr:M20 family metallopeptidase [Erysipelotrichaceae bacterium]